jgi:hypothetical protein
MPTNETKPEVTTYQPPFLLELASDTQLRETKKDHTFNPIGLQLIDVTKAHQGKLVKPHWFNKSSIILKHPNNDQLGLPPEITIPPDHQFSLVASTFQDLDTALSKFANSPPIAIADIKAHKILSSSIINRLPAQCAGLTLREAFNLEYDYYRSLAKLAESNHQKLEPAYGTYAYDPFGNTLYTYAPEFWHRLGLRVANGMMHQDPQRKMSWWEIDQKLYNSVIGFAGLSVGGNVLMGWMRDSGFAKEWKGCDTDNIEIKNLNRLAYGNTQFMVGSKADKTNPYDPLEVSRPFSKAQIAARSCQLINPYQQPYLYPNHLDPETNLETFILGTNKEPPLDVFVEETDNLRFKVDSRKLCRQLNIPVLMASDFGHFSIFQFWDFRNHPNLPLGQKTDQELEAALNLALTSGNRLDFFGFIEQLCGPDYQDDQGFMDWARGEGEQPVTSLPQLGTTSLAAGMGGKIIASYLLGHEIPKLIAINHLTHTIRIQP